MFMRAAMVIIRSIPLCGVEGAKSIEPSQLPAAVCAKSGKKKNGIHKENALKSE
jgi:hypothetical protein